MTRRTFEYAAVPGFRPLLLDLHRGDAPGLAPLVVFVHGGGWRVGSRESFGPMFADTSPSPFERLAAAGFAVTSVDYRLTGEAPFPAQLDDVSAAFAWLRDHATELGLDTGRIVVWGESAGGHLAALAGLREQGVVAVVDWYGPADLTALDTDLAEAGLVAEPAPGSTEAREALLLRDVAPAEASPVTYVHSGAPPFLLLHGKSDRFVPCAQSRRLAEALTAAGADVDLRLFDGAGHMWLGNPGLAATAFDLSLEFARTHCFGGHVA
ncbi:MULTISPECIES: alpha/beta hydrolase [Amycolatopsis]|uniref:alpha/beta hydrolase n=1 Tax=Amycolatopsis TaxID=1813 RepID=UPI000B8B6C03|nr:MULTISPECIES: alpha/beta hydrolase [Amycolatopsis]OXM63589.1 alpha/beta hydrolase [Amycolatopsis sp. KNN50.9b]